MFYRMNLLSYTVRSKLKASENFIPSTDGMARARQLQQDCSKMEKSWLRFSLINELEEALDGQRPGGLCWREHVVGDMPTITEGVAVFVVMRDGLPEPNTGRAGFGLQGQRRRCGGFGGTLLPTSTVCARSSAHNSRCHPIRARRLVLTCSIHWFWR